jgi:hypothetical protein
MHFAVNGCPSRVHITLGIPWLLHEHFDSYLTVRKLLELVKLAIRNIF